jgi:diaminopimelate epimerase
MGNPHFVIFEGLDADQAARYGSVISTSPMFPNQTNVEFAEPVGPGHFRIVVWERGCGLTLACGTGAGATGVAAVLTGRAAAGAPIRMDLPGGELRITVAADLSDVVLEGSAVRVFDGEIGQV